MAFKTKRSRKRGACAFPCAYRPRFNLAQVEIAIRHGYRHLDLALVYQNQHEVGAALRKVIPSVIKREDLFITSKLWNTSHQPARVEKELDETLRQLGLDYLDLYRTSSSILQS